MSASTAALGLALMLALGGCSTKVEQTRPAYLRSSSVTERTTHTVEPGETVYHIAHQYGVSPSRLMAANGLDDARELRVGQRLVIPGIGGGYARGSAFEVPDVWSVPRAERQFAWPVIAGQVSSPFGMRHGVMHDGVDISAPVGTAVHAADDGVVIFASRLRGYGNVVIVQHSDGYVTVYGHNERNLTREGAQVARGQVIAELGATGRASGPNLHFEVRYHNQPRNPLAYLPLPQPDSGITFARNGGS
ncbi:MAG TPA: peptidoglycan DD-metalloendopeptidase family protein [Candidatus Binataceae bacterium]|nr:peptidoglycan DD-metalloendopeptidase family protein [Candidatus Binataceae bacterium]